MLGQGKLFSSLQICSYIFPSCGLMYLALLLKTWFLSYHIIMVQQFVFVSFLIEDRKC